MAKKIDGIDNDLIKKFGKEAFISGDELEQYANSVVHVSPRIDLVLGGGIPGGSVVTLAGSQKCGKTVTALQILGKAQQDGRPTYFLNVEGRIKPRDLHGIACLDKSKLKIIRSYRDKDSGQTKILKAHEFLSIAENIANNVPRSVIVIDSISQLLTEGELINDLETQDRAPGARLLAKLCRRLCNVIPINDIILVGILHVYSNTSGYGKTTKVSGGNKIQYAMDIGLECKKFELVREGSNVDGTVVGQDVHWTTTSTAFNPPGQTATSRITYGVGIDDVYEIIDISTEVGFIAQSGSWFELVFMQDVLGDDYDEKKFKVQGKPKLIERLKNNPEEYKQLESMFHEMIGAQT